MASQGATAPSEGVFTSAWGSQQAAQARYDDFVPIALSGIQYVLKRFLTMGLRDRAWLLLSFVVLAAAWLLWPILFSLRVDGDTSMSWAAVWIPLWVFDGIGLLFFLFLVSWGKIRAPPGLEEGWRDPYPVSMRVLALAKWVLLLVFQIFLVCRLDHRIDWTWEDILSPLIAWVCLRAAGGLYRLRLQTKRLLTWKVVEAVKLMGESAMLFLQLVFLFLRLDGEVDWSWWVVFVPCWLLNLGQCCSACANHILAASIAKEIDDHENCSEEERIKILEASILMDNARHSRHAFAVSLVTTVLAVALISGADYSMFVVFIPHFLAAGWLMCMVSCMVCCFRAPARDDEAGQATQLEVDIGKGDAGV